MIAPSFPSRIDRPRLGDEPVPAGIVPDQRAPRGGRLRGLEAFARARIQGQRLLDEQVPARRQDRHAEIGVGRGGRHDGDGVEIAARQQGLCRHVPLRDAEQAGGPVAPGFVEVRHRDDADAGKPEEGGDVMDDRRPAAPDDAETDRLNSLAHG